MKKEEPNADVELLREIIFAFTRHHSDLHIELEQPGTIVMQSNRDDHPRIAGAMGRNIEAVRSIFRFIAAKRKEKLVILLAEPERGRREEIQPYSVDKNWKPDPVVKLITKILEQILRAPFKLETSSSESKATTLLEISPAKEDERIVEALQPALHTIFHAIGRAQGRALYVEMNRNEVAEAFS